ncbi:hypothetical protein FF011L_01010 [Roseimaritima multifibrata]|uniref:DUF1559 domain-containing protein n=1 Tax=Roseimaritima multifibrata TaxID=1930274 RepID=A0A517M905_9BACT|nr:DUF1559 domain-containing protein [Roseimaritima multifibrata]QDS91372.1 hypothetical protein FF011L_01010 [Roseimaritima multifibrata]
MSIVPFRLLLGTGMLVLSSLTLPAQEDGPKKLSAEFVPDNALAAIFASPNKVMQEPGFEMLPIEIVRAQGLATVGVDPMHIDRLTVVVGPPGPQGPVGGIVIQFSQDYSIEDLNPQVFREVEPQEINGREVYLLDGPPDTVLFRKDARTFIVGIGNYLNSIVEGNQGQGSLARLLPRIPDQNGVTAVAVLDQVRPMLTGMLKQNARQMPPQLQDIVRLPELTDALIVNIRPADLLNFQATVVALCTDADAAQNAAEILNGSIDFGRNQFLGEVTKDMDLSDPVQKASSEYMFRVSEKISDNLRPQVIDNRLVIKPDSNVGTVGVLVGMLLPAVQAARGAARRMQSSNNQKQILLAMHNYHSTFNHLPDAAVKDKDGKPLLSWRVSILPFIGENELYEQFHMDEPWDSEHNLPLSKKMPAIYRHPSLKTEENETVYQVAVGDGLLFNDQKPTRFRDILDGTSNTILLTETDAEHAVNWAKPEDSPIDMDDPKGHLNIMPGGVFQVGFADGSVQAISELVDPNMLKAMFTRDGREVINR